jgi:hypothetical protein
VVEPEAVVAALVVELVVPPPPVASSTELSQPEAMATTSVAEATAQADRRGGRRLRRPNGHDGPGNPQQQMAGKMNGSGGWPRPNSAS